MRDDYEFFKINQFNFQSTKKKKKLGQQKRNGADADDVFKDCIISKYTSLG
jgi:hypothetical protein